MTLSPSLHDYFSLIILKLAKLNHKKLDKTEDQDFYDNFFKAEDEDLYAQDLRYLLRSQEIQRTLADLPTQAIVVDTGCGLGHLLSDLSKTRSDLQLYGIDYSQASATLVQKRLGLAAQVQQGSLLKLPFDDYFADAVICLEVLEHISDENKPLEEIHRILKKGGRLIVSVPSHYYFPEYLPLIGHYRHYQREAFVAKLNQAGFAVKSYLNHFPNFQIKHYYLYIILMLWHKLMNRLKPVESLYRRKLLLSDKTLYKVLSAFLNPTIQKDRSIDLSTLSSSTFLCLTKAI